MQASNFSSCPEFSQLTAIGLISSPATISIISTAICLHLRKAVVACSTAERRSSLPNTIRWRWRRSANRDCCAWGHGCSDCCGLARKNRCQHRIIFVTLCCSYCSADYRSNNDNDYKNYYDYSVSTTIKWRFLLRILFQLKRM